MFRFSALIVALAMAVNSQRVVNVPESGSVNFQSENFPANYPNNHLESWQVVGPEGSFLQFDSVSFALENSCSYDWVEVVDNGESLGKHCGSDGPTDVRTSGNTATVNFKTDSSVNAGGFNISVRVAKCARGVNMCPNHDICLPSANWCNGVQDCPDGADEDCPDLSECGVSTVQPALMRNGHKIVGGVEVQPHSWPWQIAFLTNSNFQFCGGSIISDRWIMTAAHCCAGRTPSAVKVRVGAHLLTSNSEGAVNHEIEKIINHPQYSTRPATDRDFCLLKTKTKIQFGRNVAAACLPSAADVLETPETECYITGWGTTSSGGSASSRLLQTNVKVSQQSYCNTAYGGVITPTMICAANPGKDTCQGDSGGPFVCKSSEGRYKLVGVTSWGRGCAMAGYPGVYARTSTVLDWTVQNINQN